MIEKNKDIKKDAFVKRLIHPDSTARQITLTDSRFYQRNINGVKLNIVCLYGK